MADERTGRESDFDVRDKLTVETMEGQRPGTWTVWYEDDAYDFATGVETPGTWRLEDPTGSQTVLDSITPQQSLDSLAESMVNLLGRTAARRVWEYFNPAELAVGVPKPTRKQVLPHKGIRPKSWPSILHG